MSGRTRSPLSDAGDVCAGLRRALPGRSFETDRSGSRPVRYVITERFFRLGEDSDIMDESGHPVFHVDGKVLTLHDRLVIQDQTGREVASVHRKLIALRPTYQISIGGHDAAQVRKHFFTPFRDRFTIDVPGPDDLEMTGSLLDHDFTIRRGNRTVATVSKAWLTIRETYGVEIADGEDDLLILASVLALDLAEDRERAQASEQLTALGPGPPVRFG